jgi:phosphomannomutase
MKLIIFDLDGTLAESKQLLDNEMADLIYQLLEKKNVAVISGGAYKQFEKQFLKGVRGDLSKLYLFPTCSTSFYRHQEGWEKVYEEALTQQEKEKIFLAFRKSIEEVKYHPKKVYGDMIEDRTTQITFSALGQKAPIEEKNKFNSKIREDIKLHLEQYLPEFSIRLGGTTSIDVTRKGIDKSYGIRKIEEHLKIPKTEMLFVGDALYEGGNDYPVKTTGVKCIQTSGPEETKEIIKSILRN